MEIPCIFDVLDWCRSPDTIAVYTCIVEKVSITERFLQIKDFKGIHQSGKSNVDVKGIIFRSTIIHFVPRGMEKIFPSMQYLAINSCELKSLHPRDLSKLKNLRNFAVISNHVTAIPDNLFANMPNLRSISFEGNKIEFASSKLLEPLKNLNGIVRINLKGNRNINAIFEVTKTGTVGSIQELMDEIDETCDAPENFERDFNTFTRGFAELQETGDFSDFTIAVEEEKFQVHKAVFSMQSPVFTTIFKTKMQESQQLTISEFSKQAVKEFVDFFYTLKKPSHDNAKEVFALATEFKVSKLRSICEEIIYENLDQTNALEIFSLGQRYNSCLLKQQASSEIDDFINTSSEFKAECFEPEILQEIIESKIHLNSLLQKIKK